MVILTTMGEGFGKIRVLVEDMTSSLFSTYFHMFIFDILALHKIFTWNNCLMHVRIFLSILNFLWLFLYQLSTIQKAKQLYNQYLKISMSIFSKTLLSFLIYNYFRHEINVLSFLIQYDDSWYSWVKCKKA